MSDNDVTNLDVVIEACCESVPETLDVAELVELLLPGGALSKVKEGYEPRDPQIDMLEQVVRVFNGDGIAVAEAGTGVGKSMAYLIPAFGWVLKNRERVVIATATINLQQQILTKDIPTVRKLFERGDSVKVAIAKGRGQYLCRDRLDELLEEKGLFAEEQLDEIRRWVEVTKSGDRSDLPFNSDESLWARVNSDPDACSDMRCKLKGNCFLQQARKNAASAQIVITNHHLLFADLAIRSQGFGPDATVILPGFQRLIVDEAHNIEGAATSYFSKETNRFAVYKYANMLLRTRKGRSGGIVAALRRNSEVQFEALETHLSAMRTAVQQMDADILPFLQENPSFRLRPDENSLPRDRGGGGSSFESLLFGSLKVFQQAVLNCVEFLADEYKRLEDSQSNEPRLTELRIIIRRLEEVAKICGDFCGYHGRPDVVYWIERRHTSSGDRFVHLTATPIDVGPLLRESLFEIYPGIVMTSATLSVNKSISHWQKRVGLHGMERVEFHSMESPFDYQNRVLLGIPGDAPDPGDSRAYHGWLKNFLIQMLEISEGHALVLFTSYSMLREIYEHCKPLLVAMGITCFRQGDDDRARLLLRFVEESSSVLFATHSFWEGVDAPGDALKLLVICRLPFRVPTEPVLLARTEALEMSGGNAFYELSLPEAVMKLKQGFGRLMRRTSDRGVVIVTDKRIITKAYGKAFINSLPPARMVVESSDKLLSECEAMLYGQ